MYTSYVGDHEDVGSLTQYEYNILWIFSFIIQ
jgi:hypothetical protein